MVEYLTSLKAKFECFELLSNHLRCLQEYLVTGILVGLPITSITTKPFTVSASVSVKAINVRGNEILGELHLKFSDIGYVILDDGSQSYKDTKLFLRLGNTYAETTLGEFLKLCRGRATIK